MSECMLKTLACWGFRVGPSKGEGVLGLLDAARRQAHSGPESRRKVISKNSLKSRESFKVILTFYLPIHKNYRPKVYFFGVILGN